MPCKMLEGLGAQVVFSSVLPTSVWVLERRRRIHHINYWLSNDGVRIKVLGIILHAFERPGMWASDRMQLSRWGRSVPGS